MAADSSASPAKAWGNLLGPWSWKGNVMETQSGRGSKGLASTEPTYARRLRRYPDSTEFAQPGLVRPCHDGALLVQPTGPMGFLPSSGQARRRESISLYDHHSENSAANGATSIRGRPTGGLDALAITPWPACPALRPAYATSSPRHLPSSPPLQLPPGQAFDRSHASPVESRIPEKRGPLPVKMCAQPREKKGRKRGLVHMHASPLPQAPPAPPAQKDLAEFTDTARLQATVTFTLEPQRVDHVVAHPSCRYLSLSQQHVPGQVQADCATIRSQDLHPARAGSDGPLLGFILAWRY
ncbi:hypothetical protein S7711_10861 [Stachybotrys chartarum IBT 7711]|uniref:Uncharacterized protein n=1 Tax=Stachybotrys chartarum (strain CBS 109288 / IBT 7711) TaxID=1280523 RepID=A0A084AUG5_STACB|nr:hypothetical protein S7711_10861 [Stachybotrys chartarum IBT 7711]